MIGGRSESHPSDPGVSVMLVSVLVKFTKREAILLLVVYKGTKPIWRGAGVHGPAGSVAVER